MFFWIYRRKRVRRNANAIIYAAVTEVRVYFKEIHFYDQTQYD